MTIGAARSVLSGKASGLDAVDVAVGARIRTKRRLIGLTQHELGRALGVSFQQIQKYEKGLNRVSASRLQNIAQILNVPAAFFFETQRVESAATNFGVQSELDLLLATPESMALNRGFLAIKDDATRKTIILLVETIAQA